MRVRDTGLGIAPEMLPRVFELFTQADRSLAHSQGGLGIGLSLVRSLVQLHGGRVTAHSDGPGRGSEFVVYLPLRSAGQQEEPAKKRVDLRARPQAALRSDRRSSYEQWSLGLDEALAGEYRHGMATIAKGELFGGLERYASGGWRRGELA